MTVKTNGAEIKKFFSLENNDFWKNGIWCEDDEIVVDGHTMTDENCIDDIEDSAVVTLSGGKVFFGVGIEKENGPSVEAYFKSWRKKQNTVFFSFECMRENADMVKKKLSALGIAVKNVRCSI